MTGWRTGLTVRQPWGNPVGAERLGSGAGGIVHVSGPTAGPAHRHLQRSPGRLAAPGLPEEGDEKPMHGCAWPCIVTHSRVVFLYLRKRRAGGFGQDLYNIGLPLGAFSCYSICIFVVKTGVLLGL